MDQMSWCQTALDASLSLSGIWMCILSFTELRTPPVSPESFALLWDILHGPIHVVLFSSLTFHRFFYSSECVYLEDQ